MGAGIAWVVARAHADHFERGQLRLHQKQWLALMICRSLDNLHALYSDRRHESTMPVLPSKVFERMKALSSDQRWYSSVSPISTIDCIVRLVMLSEKYLDSGILVNSNAECWYFLERMKTVSSA